MLGFKKKGWYGKQLKENIIALNNGDYRRIPWIFCVFSEDHESSKLKASKALNHILGTIQFKDIINIDLLMRQTTSMEWFIDWHKLKISNFFTSSMNANERRAVIIFSSFNPNGFIREQAIHMMSQYDGTIPYIMLRQNDWVNEVRQEAAIVFDKRIENLAAGEILNALPFAEKLKWCTRGSYQEYIQRFFDKLLSPEHKEDLSIGLKSSNVRTRRICIHAVLNQKQCNADEAFKLLNSEPDPFLRRVIYEKLCRLGQNMTQPSYLFLRDKYSMNRKLALQYLYDKHECDILAIALKLLLDRNAQVRELARTIVRKSSASYDFRAVYEDNLNANTVAAILGLGEIGQALDTEKIKKYLYDSRIIVVRATMISLMRLDKDKFYYKITKMLDDPRLGVVKSAYQLINQYGDANYDQINQIFHNTTSEYTRIKCANILFTAPKWERINYMLNGLSCKTEVVHNLIIQSLRRWIINFNRSYAQIDGDQKETLKSLIILYKDNIPEPIRKDLLFLIK